MDPNQYNYQQSLLSLMQNYQHWSSQNSKFSSSPTNPTIFPLPPTNPQHIFIYLKWIHKVESLLVMIPLIGSMAECHISQFSTQVGLENITLEEKKNVLLPKRLVNYSQGMKIYFLFKHGSIFQRILLWMIKKKTTFGHESLQIIISIVGSCERRSLVN
jgi:hypothetical protein